VKRKDIQYGSLSAENQAEILRAMSLNGSSIFKSLYEFVLKTSFIIILMIPILSIHMAKWNALLPGVPVEISPISVLQFLIFPMTQNTPTFLLFAVFSTIAFATICVAAIGFVLDITKIVPRHPFVFSRHFRFQKLISKKQLRIYFSAAIISFIFIMVGVFPSYYSVNIHLLAFTSLLLLMGSALAHLHLLFLLANWENFSKCWRLVSSISFIFLFAAITMSWSSIGIRLADTANFDRNFPNAEIISQHNEKYTGALIFQSPTSNLLYVKSDETIHISEIERYTILEEQ